MAGWRFGPAVLRYASDEGELVIEIDDPRVEAVVAQTGVTIHDKTNGRQYKVTPGRHDLKSGDYEIEVTEVGGDLRLFTKEFTITRGGKTPVKVTLAPVALAKKSNPEEKVAEIRRFEGQTAQVRSVAFSPDGKRALSGGSDNSVRLWDVEGGKEIRRLDGHTALVYSVAFSPDGKRALSGSYDKSVRLWGVDSGAEIRRFEGHGGPVTSVAFSPDGKCVLSGSWDRTLRLWDVESGKELQVLKGHTAEVWTAAFLPDGQHALSGGWDHTIRLWDLKEATEIRQFKGDMGVVTSVAVSSDGLHALSRDGEDSVRLWDLTTGSNSGPFSTGKRKAHLSPPASAAAMRA